MEVASNGKTEETQDLIPEEKVWESKPEVESVREIVVQENPEAVTEAHAGKDFSCDGSNTIEKDAEVKDHSPSAEDSCEVGAKETDEGENNEIAVIEADGKLNRAKETMLPSSTSDVTGVVVDREFQSSDDKDHVSAKATDTVSVEIAEEVMPSFDENDVLPALTDVEQKGTDQVNVAHLEEKTGESSIIVYKESAESVDDSLKASTDAIVVSREDGFPTNNKGNPHVISVNQRGIQATTWTSCCGLFEVIRRNR